MPSRPTHLALIPITVVLATAVCACASRHTPTSAFTPGLTLVPTFSPTPSAALYIAHDDGISSGNGVWIGDRVLTARHVLASGDGALPERVQIDDQLAAIDVVGSGDVEARRNPREESVFLKRQEDWIIASVGGRAARETARVLPGDGSVRPGDRLYMVGYDVRGDRQVHTVPLSVPQRVELDVPVPERVKLAMLPRVDDWRGWSGSFVGRYLEASDQWEFVGIASSVLIDDEERMQVVAIVRPPEEVVRAFFDAGGPDVPVLVGLPGPLALPPGYRATSSVPLVLMDAGDRFVINVCVAKRANEGDAGHVLVSIGGCDPGVGWVAVEPVPQANKAEPIGQDAVDVPR
mgnify:CR=1 FL=1